MKRITIIFLIIGFVSFISFSATAQSQTNTTKYKTLKKGEFHPATKSVDQAKMQNDTKTTVAPDTKTTGETTSNTTELKKSKPLVKKFNLKNKTIKKSQSVKMNNIKTD